MASAAKTIANSVATNKPKFRYLSVVIPLLTSFNFISLFGSGMAVFGFLFKIYYAYNNRFGGQRFCFWTWIVNNAIYIGTLLGFALVIRWPLTTAYMGIIMAAIYWHEFICINDLFNLDMYRVAILCGAWYVSALCAMVTVNCIEQIKQAVIRTSRWLTFSVLCGIGRVFGNVTKTFVSCICNTFWYFGRIFLWFILPPFIEERFLGVQAAIDDQRNRFYMGLLNLPYNIFTGILNLVFYVSRTVFRRVCGHSQQEHVGNNSLNDYNDDDNDEDDDDNEEDHDDNDEDDDDNDDDSDEDYVFEAEADEELVYDDEEDFSFLDEYNSTGLVSAIRVRRFTRLLAQHFIQQSY